MSFIDTNLIGQWMQSPYALIILFILSLSESAFFIIPPEVLLIPMALNNQSASLAYGLFTTLASVIGASFGYWIGMRGGKPILYKLFSKEKIEIVKSLFHRYDTKAIFISAFTPIPFKIFTIAGGVFNINFKRFIITAAIGRGVRYLLLSTLIVLFGEKIRYFLEHQLDKFILISTVALIVLVGLYKIGLPFLKKRVLKQSLKSKFKQLFSKYR